MARLLRLWLLSACAAVARGRYRHSTAYRCCNDVHIRVCLPAWDLVPLLAFDAGTGRYDGYIADILEILSNELGFTYVTVPSDRQLGNYTLPAGCDIAMLYRKWMDMLPDVRRTTAITVPIYESHFTGIVHVTHPRPAFFRLLDPFDLNVWVCIVALPFLTALLVSSLEAIAPPYGEDGVERKPLRAQCCAVAARSPAIAYHMATTLLGGESYDWATWPGRVLRLGLLFVALVVASAYTANLAAFFNMPTEEIHGPDSLEALRSSRACINNPDYEALVAPFVGGTVAPASDQTSRPVYEVSFCHEQLREGRAEVWVEDLDVGTRYWRSHCRDLLVRTHLVFIPVKMGLFSRIGNAGLIANMTIATLNLMSQPQYTALRNHWFGAGGTLTCAAVDPASLTTMSVRLESMRGMFAIYALVLGLALLMALTQRTGGWKRYSARQAASPGAAAVR